MNHARPPSTPQHLRPNLFQRLTRRNHHAQAMWPMRLIRDILAPHPDTGWEPVQVPHVNWTGVVCRASIILVSGLSGLILGMVLILTVALLAAPVEATPQPETTTQPLCPEEDSCTADYRDHTWYITTNANTTVAVVAHACPEEDSCTATYHNHAWHIEWSRE